MDEARVVSLEEVFDLDYSISALRDMTCGYYAERRTQEDDRVIRKK